MLLTTLIEIWITRGLLQSPDVSAPGGKLLPLQPAIPPFGSYLKIVFLSPDADFSSMDSASVVPKLVQASKTDTTDRPRVSVASTLSSRSQCGQSKYASTAIT